MKQIQISFAKKTLVRVSIVLLLLCTVVSCDWVRSSLGMPTSTDIKNLQDKIELERSIKKQDSINLAHQALKEQSVDTLSSVNNLDRRFYLVLGSFRDDSYVDEMTMTLLKLGYSAKVIQLKNGMKMVSAGAYDSISDAVKDLKKVSAEDLCPYDAWIYDVNQNLHIK